MKSSAEFLTDFEELCEFDDLRTEEPDSDYYYFLYYYNKEEYNELNFDCNNQ